MSFDLLIRNARVVDGTGNPWFKGDVGIVGSTITFVGDLSGSVEVCEEIDANGLVLAPGFIDMHTHSDFQLLRDPHALYKIKQGVTTQGIGQCGLSPAPITDEKVTLLNSYLGFIKAGAEPDWNWRSFGEWLEVLQRLELGTNIAAFAGQGTIRVAVMGFENRIPTPSEIERMRNILEISIDEGAFGMTSGLVYPPGIYSSQEEIAEVCQGLMKKQGLYESHMRSESGDILACVKETIAIAEQNGIPAQISHHKACGRENWGLVKKTLSLVDEARSRGVDITVNQYPYSASSTTLRAILPSWVQDGGLNSTLTRLKDPDNRVKIIEEIQSSTDWDNYCMNSGGPVGVTPIYTPETPEFEGKNLVEIGQITGKDPLQAAFDVIIANNGIDTTCYAMMSEEDVSFVMKHPATVVVSDSIPTALGAKTHPRTFGTFPRVLGKYVREEKVLTLEDAIRKMTSFPAQRLGLSKKGIVKEGMDADLVIFDPDKIKDKSTYDNPLQEPEGIDHVIINGCKVIYEGYSTGQFSGKVLRKDH